ncbi:MAG TPA: hypothetical protein VLY04_00945 [Bryobacteraceae bacterium]|nr:hypothetical protein [Bryobacteraceae bacterium]
MVKRCSLTLISVLLFLGAAAEANAQMSAPVVGLIASAEGPGRTEIRPVLGVLGASSIQAPIYLSTELSRVYLAPIGGWALLLRRGKEPGLITFKGTVPGGVQAIANAATNPSRVSFSPLGRSAALLSNDAIQVLTGLDAAPQVAFQVSFRDPSGVQKVALSDDGQLLAVVTGAGQVYMLSNSMAPMLAYAGSPALGMAFLPSQSAIVIADGGSGTINLARIVNGVPAVQTVTGSLSASSAEMMVEASRDGASAFVVTSGGTSAWRVELATGSIQTLTLPATATRLDRLRDGDSFVFAAPPGRSAWFLTGRDSGLQAVFAAPAPEREVSRQ